MPNPLSGGQKTNITSVDSAIATALAGLTNPSEPAQRDAIAVLRKMRKMLELIKYERSL